MYVLCSVFCVKLCSFQHPEVSELLPTEAWFPCTAQSDTNNGLEHSYWLKVCVYVCYYGHILIVFSPVPNDCGWLLCLLTVSSSS